MSHLSLFHELFLSTSGGFVCFPDGFRTQVLFILAVFYFRQTFYAHPVGWALLPLLHLAALCSRSSLSSFSQYSITVRMQFKAIKVQQFDHKVSSQKKIDIKSKKLYSTTLACAAQLTILANRSANSPVALDSNATHAPEIIASYWLSERATTSVNHLCKEHAIRIFFSGAYLHMN